MPRQRIQNTNKEPTATERAIRVYVENIVEEDYNINIPIQPLPQDQYIYPTELAIYRYINSL